MLSTSLSKEKKKKQQGGGKDGYFWFPLLLLQVIYIHYITSRIYFNYIWAQSFFLKDFSSPDANHLCLL